MLYKSTRILLADDSKTTRAISKKFLAEAGFTNIEEADDGEISWLKISGGKPPIELIICDWHMPKINGLELLQKVRASVDLKNIPFLLVTGERNKDEVTKAVKAGVSAYVVKPFESATLLTAMERAYNLHHTSPHLGDEAMAKMQKK